MDFARYALYYVPPAFDAWAQFATAWLGWDAATGKAVSHPVLQGGDLNIAEVTKTPAKYGLHATLKPPFRLAEGTSVADLDSAIRALASDLPRVSLDGLKLARLGQFLALRPVGDTTALGALAAACVTRLDASRAPADPAELAKRRRGGLTPAQEHNLTTWGYPYVLDEFRFHITLTGRLDPVTLPLAERVLDDNLTRLLPAPFDIGEIALTGEDAQGRFHLVHRYTLSG